MSSEQSIAIDKYADAIEKRNMRENKDLKNMKIK